MVFLTLIILNICHLLGDYTHLSTSWMLSAKRFGTPLLPILAHAGVHTLLFATALFIIHGPEAALIGALIQLPTHFLIDVMKGKMNVWFPKLQDMSNKFFWVLFGVDQTLHQLVIILTTYIVCVK